MYDVREGRAVIVITLLNLIMVYIRICTQGYRSGAHKLVGSRSVEKDVNIIFNSFLDSFVGQNGN